MRTGSLILTLSDLRFASQQYFQLAEHLRTLAQKSSTKTDLFRFFLFFLIFTDYVFISLYPSCLFDANHIA